MGGRESLEVSRKIGGRMYGSGWVCVRMTQTIRMDVREGYLHSYNLVHVSTPILVKNSSRILNFSVSNVKGLVLLKLNAIN